ncbi:DNA uptake protein ComE-like DNA-binding protein [Filimonas zeae]|uniref:Helix-hairpin-helix domain-containing protein n=1 Tax=Filimonas zeae TaxID=1737353 RepID=A0A917MXU3_9BACT|nr:helix-hairpin-helix domain-containing protein [Filimonas zeae]MDR6341203.1 DNA uptake protein ComE-like DNA-binding protein [Filimonas zeae]GGH76812.1 hypothetical protein GCM10011379_42220 [Filimonas zeae]
MKTQTWKEYLSFSKKERIALIVLLTITALFWLLPRLFSSSSLPPVLDTVVLQTSSDSIILAASLAETPAGETGTASLFTFNPNTLDAAGWRRLGLSEKVARTIQHYREKGGRFYRPDDLRKIYGLHSEEADRLIPYIRIPEYGSGQQSGRSVAYAASASAGNAYYTQGNGGYSSAQSGNSPYATPASANGPHTGKKLARIDINTATIEDWIRFPGIGDVLGGRIIAFRTKLGGFRQIAQVGRTYGVKDSVFQAIKPYLVLNPATMPRLNVNTATEFQLRELPGMNTEIAQTIIAHRWKQGAFITLAALQPVIGEKVFQQIQSYLIAE